MEDDEPGAFPVGPFNHGVHRLADAGGVNEFAGLVVDG